MEFIQNAWLFFQNQILGMQWLNSLIGKGLSALGLDVTGILGGSLQFFLYDVIKIFVLLSLLIFGISYIQSYFPPERTKKILGRFHGIWANILAALLGTVTPFCSCSSIPIFMGFTSAGLPIGVTFSFLISSPMVDLGSLVLLMSIFGARVAVVYVVLGLCIAVIGGTMLEKLKIERYVEDFIKNASHVEIQEGQLTWKDRIAYAKDQLLHTVKKVAPYILLGVAIGAVIHNVIPQKLGGEHSWQQQSPGGDSGYPGWCSYVCGYFRHHPGSGESAVQGCRPGNRPVLYDGGHHSQSAVYDYAQACSKAPFAGGVHRHLHCRHRHCRVSV